MVQIESGRQTKLSSEGLEAGSYSKIPYEIDGRGMDLTGCLKDSRSMEIVSMSTEFNQKAAEAFVDGAAIRGKEVRFYFLS